MTRFESGTGVGRVFRKAAAAMALRATCSGIQIKENTHTHTSDVPLCHFSEDEGTGCFFLSSVFSFVVLSLSFVWRVVGEWRGRPAGIDRFGLG